MNERGVEVICDLGTDCSDCGKWTGHRMTWDGPEEGPVAFIRKRNATVIVRRTSTQPSFLMAITRREVDPDVSSMIENYGAMEGGVTRVAHEILHGRCRLPQQHRALVLDVGANFGYFALYAAMYGCRVIAWEPVELFRAFLHHGIALNNVSHLVQVRNRAVSDKLNLVTMGVPHDQTYWGLASVDSQNLQHDEVKEEVVVEAERVDSWVKEDVLLLKADVEGYEPQVLAASWKLLKQKKVAHVLMEYSPGISERQHDWSGLEELPRRLHDMLGFGYAAAHLPMRFATPWPPKGMEEHYRTPLPAFEEVTASSLKLDIRAAHMRATEEGEKQVCPVPPELKPFPVWATCGEWAYAAHPKGFRSSFGFNTNVWVSRTFFRMDRPDTSSASMSRGVMRLRGQASLFSPEQSMKEWTSLRSPGTATGALECKNLGVGHKVIFRCPCTSALCSEEQEAVMKLLEAGRMPMQDW